MGTNLVGSLVAIDRFAMNNYIVILRTTIYITYKLQLLLHSSSLKIRFNFNLLTGATISGNFSTVTLLCSSPKPLSSLRLISFTQKYNFIIILSKKGNSLSCDKKFFHNDKLKISYNIISLQAFIAAGNIYFFIGHHIFHHFPEHQIYSRLHPETQSQLNPYHFIRNNCFNRIISWCKDHPAYPHAQTNKYLHVWFPV